MLHEISSARRMITSLLIAANAALAIGIVGGSHHLFIWQLFAFIPLMIAIRDMAQKKHAIIRNYPLVGHLRYLFETIRPELRQYFFESDLDGKPFNRRQRSVVYQRAKNEKQTVAFGMQADPTSPGYEWT